MTVPSATVEIDIDNENDLNHRVYMWGARVRTGTDDTSAIYHGEFTDWEPMTEESERALAQRFVDWLRAQRAAVEAAGGSLLVFHWSPPEWSKLHKILGREAVSDLTGDDGVFRDVEAVFKDQFASLRGTSIKKVAPLYGFRWRVDDPGGAISQTYYTTATTSPNPAEVDAAKAWLLAYNEDDNAAMAATDHLPGQRVSVTQVGQPRLGPPGIFGRRPRARDNCRNRSFTPATRCPVRSGGQSAYPRDGGGPKGHPHRLALGAASWNRADSDGDPAVPGSGGEVMAAVGSVLRNGGVVGAVGVCD